MHSIFLFFTLNYHVEPMVPHDITISDRQSQSDIETCKIKNT